MSDRGGPVGEELFLAAHGYEAVVSTLGGTLCSLRWQGRDLVVPVGPEPPTPDYRGIICAPWPNRIAGGTYTFGGTRHHLAVTEPERGSALHGFLHVRELAVEEHGPDLLVLTGGIGGEPGYPFALRMRIECILDASGFTQTLTASNDGRETAPYGVCPHPYLVAGPGILDDWVLEVQADRFLEVTPDRLLPAGLRDVSGHPFDFREPRTIGPTAMDHAFTGLGFEDDGGMQLNLRDPSGCGVAMRWDRRCAWVQLHTADRPAPRRNRVGLAVEPMTCPPDAFNSGTDLIRLAPGEDHAAAWTILAL